MLRLLFCGLLLAAGHLCAQDAPARTVPTDGATRLELSAFFSEVIVTSGPGPDVRLEHRVTIDGEPRPDLATLDVAREDGVLQVVETGPREKDLKHPGTRYFQVNGAPTEGESRRRVRVSLTVQVPAGIEVAIETQYGGVEVTDVAGLRRVYAKYGGARVVYANVRPTGPLRLESGYGDVDLSLPAGAGADLELSTEFGELLTDFDIALDADRSEQRQFYERVVGKINGGGAQVQCRAKYDRVYLRKAR